MRGDIFYRNFSPRTQATVDLTLYFLVFFPAMIALVVAGWRFFLASFLIRETSPLSPYATPVYPLKAVIPLGAVSTEALGLIQLGLLVFAIFIGFPTSFTLLALGFVFGYIGFGRLVFDLMAFRAFAVMTNDVLIPIVLFIFMGYVLERAGVLDRLFRTILVASGRLRGSLAIATLITCAIFAMSTGIIGASVTIMGLLALPPMMRLGYNKQLATGTITAGGTLGILIPPSVLLILYAANAGVSIVKLYAAAFVSPRRSGTSR